MSNYVFRDIDGIRCVTNGDSFFVEMDIIKRAIIKSNATIAAIKAFELDVFSMLGMRNLSAFMGEALVQAIIHESNGMFMKNPHQDGYPDLLAMTEKGKAAWDGLKNNLQDKKPFSPFPTGGIEVKATCGSVPTPEVFAKRGLKKPEIGDTRIEYITGYDWKAHHRETNNLLGMFWDFVDGIPQIVAVFFAPNLLEDHWGKIIQPREGGGRTTSVSIMTREGVRVMYEGWIAVINDQRYVDFINERNKGDLISLPS